MKALEVRAGITAARHLRREGLRPEDISLIPAAAGGPKGLTLIPLDQLLFGEWLPQSTQPIDLVGGSIGAFRLATAARTHPRAMLGELAERYIHQDFETEPGRKLPSAKAVSAGVRRWTSDFFSGAAEEILRHPRYRLHVVTSRGRGLLRKEVPGLTHLGFLGAYLSNAISRRSLGQWLERVIFSSTPEGPRLDLSDLPTRIQPLCNENFEPAMLASGSIPFVLQAVQGIPHAPGGAYWDGGVTDYQLHWNYASLNRTSTGSPRLVLYPHFQAQVVPGWMDKPWKARHQATPSLDNVVLLSPRPEWVATLPNRKLPDRRDFTQYATDIPGRIRVWKQALAESERLAEEFSDFLEDRGEVRLLPL